MQNGTIWKEANFKFSTIFIPQHYYPSIERQHVTPNQQEEEERRTTAAFAMKRLPKLASKFTHAVERDCIQMISLSSDAIF